jgi:quercetin dioxygenase-like cupin family protein
MKVHHLNNMVRGWFVGDFHPAVMQSKDCEVGIKFYLAGDKEAAHVHHVATELTAIISGEVEMNGRKFGPGEIITIEPGEPTNFLAITDAVTVVVKTPSAQNDKYPV